MQYFNIQIASQLSGVASATIRAWEKRYNAVVPERAENKHRLYSEKDIEKLALLFKLTEYGQSIGKIAHLELEHLKEIYSTLMHRPYDEKLLVTPNHDRVDISKMLGNFQLALAAYKLDIISHELEKANKLLSPKEFALQVLLPLFQEIGKKVLSGELTIAQEHTLSALFTFHVGQSIGQHYQKSLRRDDLIIISTPEGEMHQIGILAAALLCVNYGLKFIYMGPNLPAASISEAANALKARAILLGSTRYDYKEGQSLEEYLHLLQQSLVNKTDIWVGGNLKPQTKSELEKKKIFCFSSLTSFDEFLAKF